MKVVTKRKRGRPSTKPTKVIVKSDKEPKEFVRVSKVTVEGGDSKYRFKRRK